MCYLVFWEGSSSFFTSKNIFEILKKGLTDKIFCGILKIFNWL